MVPWIAKEPSLEARFNYPMHWLVKSNFSVIFLVTWFYFLLLDVGESLHLDLALLICVALRQVMRTPNMNGKDSGEACSSHELLASPMLGPLEFTVVGSTSERCVGASSMHVRSTYP